MSAGAAVRRAWARCRALATRRYAGRAGLVGLVLVAVVTTVLVQGRGGGDEVDEREQVLLAASSAVDTLLSMDADHVDAGLERWAAVSTGALHHELTHLTPDARASLVRAASISRARVVQAAVVDVDGDSARVMALVEVTVHSGVEAAAGPQVRLDPFVAELQRVDGRWRVSALGPPQPGDADPGQGSEPEAAVAQVVRRVLDQVLVYDYRDPDRGVREAEELIDGEMSAQVARLFEGLRKSDPGEKLVHRSEVVEVGVQRRGGSSAELLVFLDQRTVRMSDGAVAGGPAAIKVKVLEREGSWKLVSMEVL